MSKKKFNRKHELAKIRDILNRDSYPRIEMFLLVSFTGMAGFFASYILLNFGMTTMWIRYLASIGVAYVFFIGMLWLWLQWKTRDRSSSDIVDGTINLDGIWIPNIKGGAASEPSISGGGIYSGGGSSVDFSSDASSGGGEAVGAVGEALGGIAEAEEGAIPIIVVVALLAALLSIFIVVFSLVYSAPILFSELLVDGMLSASLYRRLKGIDKYHWLESAIKRTVWPFVFAAVIFAVAGWTMAHYVPGVTSLGEVITMLKNK